MYFFLDFYVTASRAAQMQHKNLFWVNNPRITTAPFNSGAIFILTSLNVIGAAGGQVVQALALRSGSYVTRTNEAQNIEL